MKVLFGIFFENYSYSVNILASYIIKIGMDAEIIYFSAHDNQESIEKKIIQANPDIVALSFMLISRNSAFKVARVAKKLGLKVIAGGIHATTSPEDLINSNYFDAVITGDGLGVIEDVVSSYKNLEKEIIKGKSKENDSLYCDPFFSQDQINWMKETKSIQLFTHFGCPFSCTFCSAKSSVHRTLDLKYVINLLERSKKEYDVKFVDILDDTFALSLPRLKSFRKMLKERNLSFSFKTQGRTSSFSDDIAYELKLLGVQSVFFGIETASNRLLEFLNKKTTIENGYMASVVSRLTF